MTDWRGNKGLKHRATEATELARFAGLGMAREGWQGKDGKGRMAREGWQTNGGKRMVTRE